MKLLTAVGAPEPPGESIPPIPANIERLARQIQDEDRMWATYGYLIEIANAVVRRCRP